MGIEGFLITSSLLGVIGQRLMRKVCTHCAQPETPDEAMLRSLGIDPALARNGNFRRGRGCPKCSGRGYRGRTAAYEVMRMTDRMREAVLRNQGGSALKEIAIADGMMTMREAGVRKALEGETTLDEVCRVLLTDERGDNDEALPAAA
jgi:type II secretory ATPase GspE/PulE/Tfp pilus assembly ATPase PilB-like protein